MAELPTGTVSFLFSDVEGSTRLLTRLRGRYGRAATLVGAADAHRYDQSEDAVEARLDRTFFAPARRRCGTDAWNAAAREGRAFSFEDAIAYALEEPRAASTSTLSSASKPS
jgi:hypothetical protein